MFKIYDGREQFYQWDLDRKLIIEDPTVKEVHFCNRTDDCSLVCEVYTEGNLLLVDVPNILLQKDWRINVYAYDGNYTKYSKRFNVMSRTKPEDYVYTETELKRWETLEQRITELEENGVSNEVVAAVVEEYLTENYEDSLYPEKEVNLWKTDNLIEGVYYNYLNGKETANANMLSMKLDIKPNTEYVYNNGYIQLSWFDEKGSFISGVYYSNEGLGSYPETPYQTTISPSNAYSAKISTRVGNKETFIFAEKKIYRVSSDVISHYKVAKSNVLDESNVILDFTCDKAIADSELMCSGFTHNNGYYKATSTAYMRQDHLIGLDRSKISTIFKGEVDTDYRFRFGYDASQYGLTDATGGLCVEVDSSAKTLTVYTCYWGNDTSFSKIGSTTFTSNIADGNDWYISIEKITVNKIHIEMYSATCPNEIITLDIETTANSADTNLQNGFMRCWGGMRIGWASGILYVKRLRMEATGNQYAKVYLIGDSYVENAGRNPLCSYGHRLYEATNGDIVLSGRGGAGASDVLKRLNVELNVIHPKYCILQCGINDSVRDVSTFRRNLQSCITILEKENIIPILTTIPRRTDTDNLSFIQEVNPWIKSLGYKYLDVAMILSTGDGETQDTNKFLSDSVHMNIKGGESLFKGIQAILPELDLTNCATKEYIEQIATEKLDKTGHPANTYLGTDANGDVVYKLAPTSTSTADKELSLTSEYPVQNKVITAKINEITEDIPTKTSQLENDSNYQTNTEVQSAITTALEGLDVSGGGSGTSEWRLLSKFTTEEVKTIEITLDDSGNPFEISEVFIFTTATNIEANASDILGLLVKFNDKSEYLPNMTTPTFQFNAGKYGGGGRVWWYCKSLNPCICFASEYIATNIQTGKTVTTTIPHFTESHFSVGEKIQKIIISGSSSKAMIAAGSQFEVYGR